MKIILFQKFIINVFKSPQKESNLVYDYKTHWQLVHLSLSEVQIQELNDGRRTLGRTKASHEVQYDPV